MEAGHTRRCTISLAGSDGGYPYSSVILDAEWETPTAQRYKAVLDRERKLHHHLRRLVEDSAVACVGDTREPSNLTFEQPTHPASNLAYGSDMQQDRYRQQLR